VNMIHVFASLEHHVRLCMDVRGDIFQHLMW
jgi:hypothetical protein